MMLNLEEQRAELQSQLSEVDAKLDSLKRRLISGSPASRSEAPSAPKAAAVAPAAPAQPRGRRGRPKRVARGELKSRIFSELEKAGSSGIKVMDLARSLGTKPANIYAWFHAAVKRYPGVKKVGNAQYRLVGKSPSASPATAAPAPAAKPAAKPQKAAAAPAARGRKGKRGRRGEVQEKILASLKSAGSKGIAIKDLSTKTGVPYRNLQVWFATTGKKHSNIKKVGPATYQLAG